jgi:hypothetical protein
LLIIFFLFAVGLPSYFWVAQQDWNPRDDVQYFTLGSTSGVLLGLIAASLISLTASYLALRMGQNAFRELES